MRPMLALVALPLGLAACLAAEILLPVLPSDETTHVARPRAVPATALSPSTDISIDALVATALSRPLMDPTRRPRTIVTPAVAASIVSAEGTDLPRLSGVIITPDGRRAIFTPATGKPLVLAEGDHVGHAVIKTISPNQVILTGSEGDEVIHPRLSPLAPPPSKSRPGSGK